MRSRKFVSFMACLVALGVLGVSAAADAVWAGRSFQKSRESARNYVLEGKRRDRGVRILLPIGPSYIYQDYPYYYARGYYPYRVGPHYVYYGPNSYGRRNYRPYSGGCSDGRWRCVSGYSRGPR